MKKSNLRSSMISVGIFSVVTPLLIHGYLMVIHNGPNMGGSVSIRPARPNYKMLSTMNYETKLETNGAAMWYQRMKKQVEQQTQTQRLQSLNYSKKALENLLSQQTADSVDNEVYYVYRKTVDSLTQTLTAYDSTSKRKDDILNGIAYNYISNVRQQKNPLLKRN